VRCSENIVALAADGPPSPLLLQLVLSPPSSHDVCPLPSLPIYPAPSNLTYETEIELRRGDRVNTMRCNAMQ
jgi:hypothetical protein